MDGIAERLVDMALHLRVEGDHLADRHAFLLDSNQSCGQP
jgi:hypothetical protein